MEIHNENHARNYIRAWKDAFYSTPLEPPRHIRPSAQSAHLSDIAIQSNKRLSFQAS